MPNSLPHRLDHLHRRDVVQIAGGCGDAAVAELLGDDTDVDAFRTQLSGVGVPEAMCVDAFLDAGFAG